MSEPIVPYIRRAWYDILRPDTFIKERAIFDYELLYVKDGIATVTVEENTYVGQVGDVFIFRPHQRHSIHVSAKDSLVQPHVHFDLLYRENRESIPISFKNLDEISAHEATLFHPDILDQYFTHVPSLLHPHTPESIERLLFDLIHEFNHPSRFHEIRLTQLFLRLWEQVLNEVSYNFDTRSTLKDEYAEKIMLYIESHISSPLKISDLMDLTHFSQAYIYSVFREAYGTAPLQYHTHLRIEKAKSMIRNTNMSITEISERLGFSHVQDFCRVFKKFDGVTPSAYRHIHVSDPQ